VPKTVPKTPVGWGVLGVLSHGPPTGTCYGFGESWVWLGDASGWV